MADGTAFCGPGGFGPFNALNDFTFCFEDAVLLSPAYLYVIVATFALIPHFNRLPRVRVQSSFIYSFLMAMIILRAILAVLLIIVQAGMGQAIAASMLSHTLATIAWICTAVSVRTARRRAQGPHIAMKVFFVGIFLISIVQFRSAVLTLQQNAQSVESGGAITASVLMLFAGIAAVIPHRPSRYAYLPVPKEPSYSTFEGPAITSQQIVNEDEDALGEEVTLGWGSFLKVVLRPEAWLLILGISLSLISAGANMVTIRYTGIVIDLVRNTQPIGPALVLLASIYLVHAVALGTSHAILELGGARIANRLRLRFVEKLLDREISFFDSTPVGALVNRLIMDCRQASMVVSGDIGQMLSSCFMCIGALIFLFTTSWRLTLLMLSPLPFIAILVILQSSLLSRLSSEVLQRMAQAAKTAEEVMRNFSTVRLACMEESESERYNWENRHTFEVEWRLSVWSHLCEALIHMCVNASIILGLWYGAVLVINGTMSPGNLVSYILFAVDIIVYLGIFPALGALIAKAVGAAEKVFRIMYETPVVPNKGGIRPDKFVGEIEFDHVTFAYPSHGSRLALQDVSFKVPDGKVVAIVGESGSGKSTVFSMIQRFYDTDAGRIRVSGHDIVTLDPAWMREHLGVVGQEPVLFGGTIESNVAYGAEFNSGDNLHAITADDFPFDEHLLKHRVEPNEIQMQHKVVQASKQAYADTFVREQTLQYKQPVGERGTTLSGGQKQRIAIARAIMREPRVLLLDEATSALDHESEQLVQQSLERLMQRRKGMTTIVIAHRLSTVVAADIIYVMAAGRVVEAGTHDELLARGGEYSRLVARQLGAGVNKDVEEPSTLGPQ